MSSASSTSGTNTSEKPKSRSAWHVLVRSVKEFSADDMLTYAAAVSYQVFFSLFPFIIFLLSLLGMLNLSGLFDTLLQQAQTVMPSSAFSMIEGIVSQIRGQAAGSVLSFGVIIALWSASSAVRMTMHAMNVAYDVDEERPAWKKIPLSILYTLLLAGMIIAAVGLILVGGSAAQWVSEQIGFGGGTLVTLWTWARIPLAFVLIIAILAIVYALFPYFDHPFRLITPGAIVAVIVWIAASLGFSFYVSNFSSYSATYGSIAAVIILLLYFFISAAVVLFGAEINAEVYREVDDTQDT
jgi:membrane protein